MYEPATVHTVSALRRRALHRSAVRARHSVLFRAALFGTTLSAIFGSLTFAPSVAAAKLSAEDAGLAFYRGKVIHWDTATPGSTQDLAARALTPAMESYLHATIEITDMPGAGSVPPQDAVAAAVPDGLTIGQLNTLADAQSALTGVSSIDFNPERVAFIGGTAPPPNVLAARNTSPFRTFAQLKASTTPVSVLAEFGSSAFTELAVLMGVLKVDTHYITGYASVGAIAQGFLRGDGPVALQALATTGPMIVAGQAYPLVVSNVPPPGMGYRAAVAGTPTIAQLFTKYPPRTAVQKKQEGALLALLANQGTPLFTQPRVPSNRLDALRAAFRWALKQPSVKTQLLNDGLSDVYVGPVTAKSSYITCLTDGKSIVQFLVTS